MPKKPRFPGTTNNNPLRCPNCPYGGLVPASGPAAKFGVCCKCYRKRFTGHQGRRRKSQKGKN